MATSTQSAPVRRLWVSVLLGYLAFGATLQVLPGWVDTRFGGGPVAAGLAVGVAFAATALARPLAGRAGDAGKARPVVVAGGALIAVGAVGQLVAPDLGLLLVARLLMGAGEAALFSGALPWVLAGTAAERRGRTAGWFGLSMWGGLAAGPVLAAGVGALGGFRTVWSSVVMLAVASALVAATTRSARTEAASGRAVMPSLLREVLPRGAGVPGLAFALAAYGYGTISSSLVPWLTRSGWGVEGVGLAVFAVGFLLARLVGSPLVDRFGGPRVTTAIAVVSAAGLTVLVLAGSGPVALIGAAVVGLGVSLAFPAATATTVQRAGSAGAGAAVGATTSFWDLGIMVAGPLSGVVAAGHGYPAAFAVAALVALGGAVVGVVLARQAGRGGSVRSARARARTRPAAPGRAG